MYAICVAAFLKSGSAATVEQIGASARGAVGDPCDDVGRRLQAVDLRKIAP